MNTSFKNTENLNIILVSECGYRMHGLLSFPKIFCLTRDDSGSFLYSFENQQREASLLDRLVNLKNEETYQEQMGTTQISRL